MYRCGAGTRDKLLALRKRALESQSRARYHSLVGNLDVVGYLVPGFHWVLEVDDLVCQRRNAYNSAFASRPCGFRQRPHGGRGERHRTGLHRAKDCAYLLGFIGSEIGNLPNHVSDGRYSAGACSHPDCPRWNWQQDGGFGLIGIAGVLDYETNLDWP